jgi:hypothetical protein
MINNRLQKKIAAQDDIHTLRIKVGELWIKLKIVILKEMRILKEMLINNTNIYNTIKILHHEHERCKKNT